MASASIWMGPHLCTKQTPLIRHEPQKQWLGESVEKALPSIAQAKGKRLEWRGKTGSFLRFYCPWERCDILPSIFRTFDWRDLCPSMSAIISLRYLKIVLIRPGKRFVQDGDPSQNSAAARRAFSQVGAFTFSIPPRSPDLNPIENLFHLVSKQLQKDALDMQITRETFAQFSDRQ